jgi:hypothetical protein
VEHSRSLLRNPVPTEGTVGLHQFSGLTENNRRRLKVKPAGAAEAARTWRPRGNYRRLRRDDPEDGLRYAAVQRSIRACPRFGEHYREVVVAALFQHPKPPHRIVARVDGFGSTFCYHRRGPAGGSAHASSHVYFVLDPVRGMWQRCFSEKVGSTGATCRSWDGTPPHDIYRPGDIWPRARAERNTVDLPTGPGATVATLTAVPHSAAAARQRECLAIERCCQRIDRTLALQGRPELDKEQLVRACGALVAGEAGTVLPSGFVLQNRERDVRARLEVV